MRKSSTTRRKFDCFDTQAHTKYTNVILPKKPQDFTFDETIASLLQIFGRRETVFNTRYKCLQLSKMDGMDIVAYQGLVNKGCEEFKFTEMTDDQFKCLVFVRGLTSKSDFDTRIKLLSKLDSDTTTTLNTLVTEYERLGKKDSSLIQNKSEGEPAQVNTVSSRKNQKQKKSSSCWNCGSKTRHPHSECPARNTQCKFCNATGHRVEFCKKKKQALNVDSEKTNDDKKSKGDSNRSSQSKDRNEKQSRRKINSICVNQINSSDRKFIDLFINNQPIQLQIDSAADVTVISRDSCKKLSLEYASTSLQPNDASGNPLNLVGETLCNIELHGKTIRSTIYVSKSSNLNVFGIDLIKKFDLWKVPFDDICSENRVHQIIQPNTYTDFLKQQFPSCFGTTLGKCTKFQAHLQLKPGAYPPFNKSRPVPFAIQPQVERELRRLESLGIIKPVTTAKCAAPIVVKQKKSGEIRICADFSTGLNDALEDHRYPIPLPEDIFATLSNSECYSHVDLTDAFLQFEVDDESK